jgi:hypothetical protein
MKLKIHSILNTYDPLNKVEEGNYTITTGFWSIERKKTKGKMENTVCKVKPEGSGCSSLAI